MGRSSPPLAASFDTALSGFSVDRSVRLAAGDRRGLERLPFDDRNMAYFTLDALAEVCDVMDLVTFRPNVPPTRLTDATGNEIPSDLVDLGPVTIDGTPPVIVCPTDVRYECDEWEEFFDKMHFPQWPDEVGWDVLASGFVEPFKVLADDWLCIETGLVKDVHFWGSWEGGNEGLIEFFVLSRRRHHRRRADGHERPPRRVLRLGPLPVT